MLERTDPEHRQASRRLLVASFGGCPLYNPLQSLREVGKGFHLFKAAGFKRPPFALSSGAAVQLHKFCTGEIAIPLNVRRLCYADPEHVPSEKQLKVLQRADLALVEMSTPLEMVYDGFILNSNRLKDRFLVALKDRFPELARPITLWRSAGMQKMNEPVRAEAAAALLKALPKDTEDDLFIRDLIEGTRVRETKTPHIVADLAELRSRVAVPTGMIIHNFTYMPDGRPVSWPADFRDNCVAAAKELGMPVFDAAGMVAEYGAVAAMHVDMRHYSKPFTPIVADAMHRFMGTVIEGGNP